MQAYIGLMRFGPCRQMWGNLGGRKINYTCMCHSFKSFIVEYYMRRDVRVEVNAPRNHLGDVALIQRRNKDLAENQSGSTVKLIRLVLRPVGFDDSKWQTYLVGNKLIRFFEYMKLVLTLKLLKMVDKPLLRECWRHNLLQNQSNWFCKKQSTSTTQLTPQWIMLIDYLLTGYSSRRNVTAFKYPRPLDRLKLQSSSLLREGFYLKSPAHHQMYPQRLRVVLPFKDHPDNHRLLQRLLYSNQNCNTQKLKKITKITNISYGSIKKN